MGEQGSYDVSKISGNIVRKWLILLLRYKGVQTPPSPTPACWASFLTFPVAPWVPDWTLAGGEENDIFA